MSGSYEYGLGGTTRCWRELAIQHLPKLREVILVARSHVDMWQRLKEFLSDAGVNEDKRDEVKSVYDYAWWCVADSGDEDLTTEVETFFYEDLVFSDFDEQMPLYINELQFQRLESSFRYLFSDEYYADFRSRYFAKRAATGLKKGKRCQKEKRCQEPFSEKDSDDATENNGS